MTPKPNRKFHITAVRHKRIRYKAHLIPISVKQNYGTFEKKTQHPPDTSGVDIGLQGEYAPPVRKIHINIFAHDFSVIYT